MNVSHHYLSSVDTEGGYGDLTAPQECQHGQARVAEAGTFLVVESEEISSLTKVHFLSIQQAVRFTEV